MPIIKSKKPIVGTIQWNAVLEVQAKRNIPAGTTSEPRSPGMSLCSGEGIFPALTGRLIV